jgi:WD40 repeat protein
MVDLTLLSDERYVGKVPPKGNTGEWDLVVRSLRDGNTVASWGPPRGWLFDRVGASSNGQYVGVVLDEDPVTPLPDYNIDSQNLRIGLIGPKADKLDWVVNLSGPEGEAKSVREVRPSDDGAYVAVAGWYYGAAVVDVRARKIMWASRPKDEVGMVTISFCPDNTVVYAGGGEGCVYGMATAGGKMVSRWFATASGRSEYGCRISTVAVSPDGRFVAAGTGPEGVAYVWERQTGKLLNVLNHGGSTILVTSFSPDSNALATFLPGTIKVWTMPRRSGPAGAEARR